MIAPLLLSALVALVGVTMLYVSRGASASRTVVQELLRDAAPVNNLSAPEMRGGVEKSRALWWIVGSGCSLGVVSALGVLTPQKILMSLLIGGLAGEWWNRQRQKRIATAKTRLSERSLPMVMERLVMAVGTGLDVVPALKEAAAGGRDPVSIDIERMVSLAEDGLSVEEAIKAVSDESGSSSLKHAFMHIRLAYQQGGEVVRPLREISDATQTAYQEGVEEEIAKLPVKAVVPLLLTFAGLIVCFLTVPLIQVGTIAKKVTYAGP